MKIATGIPNTIAFLLFSISIIIQIIRTVRTCIGTVVTKRNQNTEISEFPIRLDNINMSKVSNRTIRL